MPNNREIRFGLVLYGGVSLAVYENGVAQEFYRAVRGEGFYGLVRHLGGADIVVDIISGTSAGGVNGIMLAYALANQRTFAPSANLWCDKADIFELLRKKTDERTTSVLDSRYYQDELEKCFRDSLVFDPSAPDLDAVGEIDLFITGTNVHGDISTVYDELGHAIDVKNHRSLFKLGARRGGRKNDLGDATPGELATLARITSCFPAAFEPVSISLTDGGFARWGKLRKPAVYLDGGILNNKPFTSTLGAIAKRTANRAVDRLLVYVEPDPEVFPQAAGAAAPSSPSLAEAAIASLISIPGYQSIAADLDAIQAHNESAGRIQSLFDSLPAAPEATPDCLDRATILPAVIPNCDNTAYLSARLIQLRDTAVTTIINEKDGREFIDKPADRRSGRILVESFNRWEGDGLVTLLEYDVFYRKRRAAHLADSLMRRARSGQPVEAAAWDMVNHFIELYEMTEWAMVDWLNHWTFKWQKIGPENMDLERLGDKERDLRLAGISAKVWGQAAARLESLLKADIDVPAEPSAATRTKFYEGLRECMKCESPAVAVPERNLLHAIDITLRDALKALPSGDTAKLLRNEYCRFAEVDRQLFPLLAGSAFHYTDSARVVRFSPRDARRGLSKCLPGQQKVCGSLLGAFGGFFKKSWRANDIMVGRFDAACLITEGVLAQEKLGGLPPPPPLTQQQIEQWFPNLDPGAATGLTTQINDVMKNPRSAAAADWDAMLEAIVSAAHGDICREEWPKVLTYALQQEHFWSRYRNDQTPPGKAFSAEALAWVLGKRRPDEVLVQVAAHAICAGALPAYKPGMVCGGEFLEEIPLSALQELGSLAVIRLGKSLVASIPNAELAARVKSSAAYKWIFERVAVYFYRIAHIQRTQPESRVIVNSVIPAVCLTALMAAIIVLLFLPWHPFPWKAWLTAIGLALGVLVTWWKLFRR